MHGRKLGRIDSREYDKHDRYDKYRDRRDSPSDRRREREVRTYGSSSSRHHHVSRDHRERERSRYDKYRERERSRSRDRERDRERERDRRRDYTLRDKSESLSPPPKEQEKPASPESFGDWSGHKSSSGKKYYYNSKSEVSQWEKPKEWLEWEQRKLGKSRDDVQVTPPKDRTPAKVEDETSPVSEDSPISTGEEDNNTQPVIDDKMDSNQPQFLPKFPTKEQFKMERQSPISERSPSPTSSQERTPPPESKPLLGSTALLTSPSKPFQLSASLANYYDERLITHITIWQVDHIERQANRYAEELFHLGSVHCAQISADLKMARSMVRLAEIQATLQEQRALFLRQQIKELDDKQSNHAYMPQGNGGGAGQGANHWYNECS